MTLTASPIVRYTKIAVILHWLIALAIILMLMSGLTMKYGHLEKALRFQMYQWHKSLGVITLVLVVLRVFWRIWHKPPALPSIIPPLEAFAAHAGHFLLYVFIILMPLSGWLIVSSSSFGLPTIVFGLFEWPHIPKIAGNHTINETAEFIHWWGTWIVIALIAGHVGAVVFHYMTQGVNLMSRMWFKGKNDVI